MDKPISIIYVEDEPSIAELVREGLNLFGIHVDPIYGSAEELLEERETTDLTKADLFFFDIRLPKMTGLELATQLREKGEKRPFIVVSAWPAPSQETLTNINAAFLPKPFSFPEMVQTVQTLVQK